MTFVLGQRARAAMLPLVGALGLLAAGAAQAQEPVAVVPTVIIYPGQPLNPSDLQEVEVTNPNIRSDYVHAIADLRGMVATRTLLPGRVVPKGAVRKPYAVEQGQKVRLVYSDGGLTITAPGMPLENAAVGDLIKVRNIDSGVTISGTVMKDGTVEVAAQ
ncbi:MAG: flagellar basal body P-ring formation chaperone FlgA [Pararhizobium sp.]